MTFTVTRQRAQEVHDLARARAGLPYGYGGAFTRNPRDTTDCSGLVLQTAAWYSGRADWPGNRYGSTESFRLNHQIVYDLGFKRLPAGGVAALPFKPVMLVGLQHGGGGVYSHTACTLMTMDDPGGPVVEAARGVDWESQGAGVFLYDGARAWNDPLFHDFWYLDARLEAAGAEPEPGGGAVPALSDPVFGIDVSNHQGNFDFARAAAEGYRFATHKVTEGTGYRDPYWPRARTEMAKHFPGRFGGYVFCRTNTDPQREADYLIEALGDRSIPVQIDYEDTTNGGSGRDLAARVKAYRDRGIKLLPVYVPRWFWRDRMGSPDLSFLADVGVWNSDYVNGSGFGSQLYPGNDYRGWASFTGAEVRILQFTEKAAVAGQLIDANAVKNTAAVDAIFGPTNDGGFLMADTQYQSLFIDDNGMQSTFKADMPTYVRLIDAKVERERIENAKLRAEVAEQGRIIRALAAAAGVKP